MDLSFADMVNRRVGESQFWAKTHLRNVKETKPMYYDVFVQIKKNSCSLISEEGSYPGQFMSWLLGPKRCGWVLGAGRHCHCFNGNYSLKPITSEDCAKYLEKSHSIVNGNIWLFIFTKINPVLSRCH